MSRTLWFLVCFLFFNISSIPVCFKALQDIKTYENKENFYCFIGNIKHLKEKWKVVGYDELLKI